MTLDANAKRPAIPAQSVSERQAEDHDAIPTITN